MRYPLILVLLTSCGDGELATPKEDPTAAVFAPEHLIEVSITIREDDWDGLRAQTRSLTDVFGANCLDEPRPRPYSYFPGDVTIDGESLELVGLRKKGFFGSLDTERPSLKIKFDEYLNGQVYSGMDRMTLNNCKQDPSYIKQCIGYRVFNDAGIPASRCNFAHVTVNGRDLGIYAHVEAVKVPMLERYFHNPTGNLYEGALSDFRPEWTGTFERKTNEDDADRSDLDAVVAALEAPDNQLVTTLDPILNVDSFLTFWATEVLIAHWDGYNGNTNNFFVYDDPTTRQFFFLPWGIDGILFERPDTPPPVSVYASGALSHRLYQLPEIQTQYVARMGELLDGVWDEGVLLAEIDRMEALITPFADPDGSADHTGHVQGVRDFVANRNAILRAELQNGPPVWTEPLRGVPCLEPIGDATGTFNTTWGTVGMENPFDGGTGTFEGTLYDAPLPVWVVGSTSGMEQDPPPGEPPEAIVQVVFGLDDGTFGIAHFAIYDPTMVQSGTTIDLDLQHGLGALFHFVPTTEEFNLVGLFVGGALTFDEADTSLGATVSGSIDSPIIQGW